MTSVGLLGILSGLASTAASHDLRLLRFLVTAWVALGIAGLPTPRGGRLVARVLFPLGALICVAVAVLAAIFLLGVAGAGISTFSAGYFRAGEGTAPGLMGLQYHVFLASMAVVMLADDAYLFMVAWETMALSSYFLVTSQ